MCATRSTFDQLAKLLHIWTIIFDCLDLTPCEREPCQNGATCTDDGHGGYTCDCSSGYGGRNCTIQCETVYLK